MPDAAAVAADSHVTLHYRLALADGTTLVSTFGGKPATFQLGQGQLAEPFERCLAGMRAATRSARGTSTSSCARRSRTFRPA